MIESGRISEPTELIGVGIDYGLGVIHQQAMTSAVLGAYSFIITWRATV